MSAAFQTDTPAQQAVADLLRREVDEGREDAVQVAVYRHGALVVDAWAAPAGTAVDGDSLFPFFSTGKAIAATAVHRLVERGVLRWDDPVARYWPEFAARGKGGITLRHVLDHTAGLPTMPERMEDVRPDDWGAMCDWLAASEPLHAPGTRFHYHAITYAWLLGEPTRRADGRDFARIIREEVCEPLGIETLYFGVPADRLPRCVDAVRTADSPDPTRSEDPVARRAIPAWVCPLEDWINRDAVRRACIPASNGFGTARDIARHYAALVGAGVDGVRLLRKETLAEALQCRPPPGVDPKATGYRVLGYVLRGPDSDPGRRFGGGGYGGSLGAAEPAAEIGLGIVKSRMGGDLAGRVLAVLDECL